MSATFAVQVPSLSQTTLCPGCGFSLPDASLDDRRRIAELEGQVRILTEKATAAVDKLADYEDQLYQLRTRAGSQVDNDARRQSMESKNTLDPKPSRFSLLNSRRIATPPVLSQQINEQPTSRRESDLQAALQREQEARQRAEGKLSDMNTEIEDLSVQLFQQANEMVAAERKARAKLEERVEILEQRDDEKRKRLDRLENALKRIERVRGLLATNG